MQVGSIVEGGVAAGRLCGPCCKAGELCLVFGVGVGRRSVRCVRCLPTGSKCLPVPLLKEEEEEVDGTYSGCSALSERVARLEARLEALKQ